ncbi:MAG: DUF5317 family protein [Clostridiaceae bacterium]
MILLVAAALGIALGLASGGSFRSCAKYPLYGAMLPILALLLKAGASFLLEPQKLAETICILQYALVISFLLLNAKHGLWPLLAFLGAFSNFVVILLNGGCMPVAASLMGADASRIALLHAGKIYAYTAISEKTLLPFLGDVLRFGPAGLPFGFASAGDIVLCAGVALLCFQMTRKFAPAKTQSQPE